MSNYRYNTNDPSLPSSVQESIAECNSIQAQNMQVLDESGSEFRELLEQFLDWYETFNNFTKRTVRKYMQIPGVPYVHNYSWLNDVSDEEYNRVVDAYDDAASAETQLSNQTHNIKVFRDELRDAFNRVATQWNKTASEDDYIYRLD